MVWLVVYQSLALLQWLWFRIFFLPQTDFYLTLTILLLIACIAGFFPYNYNPAIIYLGDTGALFIGFMIWCFIITRVEKIQQLLPW